MRVCCKYTLGIIILEMAFNRLLSIVHDNDKHFKRSRSHFYSLGNGDC
jgi:hypothetical protein